MSTPVATPAGFEDYGPEFSATDAKPPKISQENPPRAAKRFSLGDNKKTRSGVRKLNVCDGACPSVEDDEKPCECDRSKLVGWYDGIEMAAQFVRPRLAAALAIPGQKTKCANAWISLADDNDKVRRTLLAMVEGGGWGKVMFTHLPLFIAVLPQQFVEQVLMSRMNAYMDTQAEDTAPPFHFGPFYPADLQGDPNA